MTRNTIIRQNAFAQKNRLKKLVSIGTIFVLIICACKKDITLNHILCIHYLVHFQTK